MHRGAAWQSAEGYELKGDIAGLHKVSGLGLGRIGSKGYLIMESDTKQDEKKEAGSTLGFFRLRMQAYAAGPL